MIGIIGIIGIIGMIGIVPACKTSWLIIPIIRLIPSESSFASGEQKEGTCTMKPQFPLSIVLVIAICRLTASSQHGSCEQRSTAEDGKSASHYGECVMVWRKQADGSGQFILDIGNPSPPPANK